MMIIYSLSSSLLLLASLVLNAYPANESLLGAGHPLTSASQRETTKMAFTVTTPFKEDLETIGQFEKRSGSENSLSARSDSEKSDSERSPSARSNPEESGSDRSSSPRRPSSRRPVERSSSSTSVKGSDGDLTPIYVTDSAPSDNKRKNTPGNVPYHEGMYKFYHKKAKYHQAIGDAYKAQNYDSQASQHYKESESSKKKKFKHRKYYQDVLRGSWDNDYVKTHVDIVNKGKVPTIDSKSEAKRIINDPAVRFRQRKGHLHLVSKPVRQKPQRQDKRQRRQ